MMAGYKVEFSEVKCAIKDKVSNVQIARIQMTTHRLSSLNADDIGSAHVAQGEEDLSMLWHRRYGYLNQKGLQLLSLEHMVVGLPPIYTHTTM